MNVQYLKGGECVFLLINGDEKMMKERDDRDKRQDVPEESKPPIEVDEYIEDSYEEDKGFSVASYIFFEYVWPALKTIMVGALVVVTAVCLIERIRLTDQIDEMQETIDQQNEMLDTNALAVNLDAIDDEYDLLYDKMAMAELKTAQVYIENRMTSLELERINEERIIDFYNSQIESTEDADLEEILLTAIDGHQGIYDAIVEEQEELEELQGSLVEIGETIESEGIPSEGFDELMEGIGSL